MNLDTVMDATDYIKSLEYDKWILFYEIPQDIKLEVIIQMDECTEKAFTFNWEGDWFMKVQR